ncbi:RHS repeat-associated core domain-containing protein [Streptomyces sp. NPDC002596]
MTRTRQKHARRRARRATVAVTAILALAGTTVPAMAADPEAPKPTTAWGKPDSKAKMPPVKAGKTKPPANRAEVLSAEAKARRAAQEKRAEATAGEEEQVAVRAAALAAHVPEGQGQVPWQRISDVRVTDSLVARVNYSSGNLMLASTDLQLSGVGQSMQLTGTYNSLDAPWGKVSQRWWSGYERYLQILADEDKVVLYDATGAAVSFTKKADGSFTTPKGYRLDLANNDAGEYVLTDRASGRKDTYTTWGTLLKVTDRNGGVLTVTQHDEGEGHKGFKVTDERSGRWVDLVKTDAAQWQAKDSTGRTVVHDLDGAGNLVRTTDAEGKATDFGYDASGRVTKITTSEGRVTVFTYDAANRVTSMTRATGFDGSGDTGPTYNYTYSADSGTAGTTKATNPGGNTTTYAYGADGAVTKVTDALGKNRESTYDANLNVETAVDAMGVGSTPGNVTAYGWDARSNLASMKLPTGATAALTGYRTIAGADVPGKVTGPDGEEVSYTYDDAGNTLTEIAAGADGGTRTFTYNPSTPTCGGFEGQRCSVKDANGQVTKFSYDAKGNLTKVTPPSPQGATIYAYDDAGRVTSSTDGRGTKVDYRYDHRDRITEVRGATNWAEYAWDGDGNLRQRSDATGITGYAFDPLSRETVRTLQDGSQTVLEYTAEGNVESYTDPAGKVSYGYDAANRLTSLTAPDGEKTTYAYNANDARTTTTLPGGTVEEIKRDASDRPTRITATSDLEGTMIDIAYSYSYTKDGATQDGSKIRTRTDHVDNLKRTYDYDTAGRLSYAAETDTGDGSLNNNWLYCYDKAGNLTSQNGNLPALRATAADTSCPGGTAYSHNDAGQITGVNGDTTGWSHDSAGNETAARPLPGADRTSQYNDFSQTTSTTVAGDTSAARYASTDQSERTRFGDITYHHGPVGLSSQTSSGQDTDFTREPSGGLHSFRTGGATYYYLTDALGTVEAVIDAKGEKVNWYYYSPNGITDATEQTAQPYRFTGGYEDSTGLYHFQARYYDPQLGRFTQPDPAGLETNPYLYASGDPTNIIDPTGLWSMPGWAKAAITTVAVVAAVSAAAVVVGAACGATAGAGCLIAGSVTAGLWGGAAGGATAAALGDSTESGTIGGVVSGVTAPFMPIFRGAFS